MKATRILGSIAPVITLFILSPVIAELFSSSTPASRVEQLPFEALLYGSGALLVRELVRRTQMGWSSLILLGLAYGFIEEGLVLQSMFNPNFLNYDVSYGSRWGVNWPLAQIIITNHAFWSITIPVAVTEAFFPGKRNLPWLNIPVLVILSAVFIWICIMFHNYFVKTFGFVASWEHFLFAGILVVIFVLAAFWVKDKHILTFRIRSFAPVYTLLICFVFSFAWQNLLSIVFAKETWWPVWLMETTGIAIAGGFLVLVSGWTNTNWTNYHRNALALGAMFAGMSFGMMILIQQKVVLNIIWQAIFIVVAAGIVVLTKKKLFG